MFTFSLFFPPLIFSSHHHHSVSEIKFRGKISLMVGGNAVKQIHCAKVTSCLETGSGQLEGWHYGFSWIMATEDQRRTVDRERKRYSWLRDPCTQPAWLGERHCVSLISSKTGSQAYAADRGAAVQMPSPRAPSGSAAQCWAGPFPSGAICLGP